MSAAVHPFGTLGRLYSAGVGLVAISALYMVFSSWAEFSFAQPLSATLLAETQRPAMLWLIGALLFSGIVLKPRSWLLWFTLSLSADHLPTIPGSGFSGVERWVLQGVTLTTVGVLAVLMIALIGRIVGNRQEQQAKSAPAPARAHQPAPAPKQASLDASLEQVGEPPRRLPKAHRGFSGIIGMAELKKELLDRATGALKRGGDEVGNGILLDGEPGNGKTFIIQALARELDLPLKVVTPGDVTSQWIGRGTERVKAVFDEVRAFARTQGPCVLFFDEIESIAARRGASNQSEEHGKLIGTFLTEMVSLRGQGILLVAATNLKDQIDEGVLREGRLDFKITVPPPDYEGRLGLLQGGFAKHTPGTEIDPVLIEALARRWEGFSVKRLLAVTEAAKDYVAANKVRRLDYPAILQILRKVQGGQGRVPEDTKPLSEMILADEQRRQLQRLAAQLRNAFEFESKGGALPSGVLLYGPPGTGKTAVTRSLAKECEWAFLKTTGTDLMTKPSLLDDIVRQAKNLRPCIVFIDEAENLLADRGNYGPNDLQNKLLAAIDGAGGKVHDVIWLAATNYPDRLDDAVTRGGRFTLKIGLQPPDGPQMEAFAVQFLTRKGWSFGTPSNRAAELLDGKSIADAQAILQEAINIAISRQADGACDSRYVMLADVAEARLALGLHAPAASA
jgi:transitional endoplasmic reticulum ATPase